MKTKFADINDAMSHVQGAKVLMECLECRKSFNKANPNDHTKCPKCGDNNVKVMEEVVPKTPVEEAFDFKLKDMVFTAWEQAKKVGEKKAQQVLGKLLKNAGYGDLLEGEESEEVIEEAKIEGSLIRGGKKDNMRINKVTVKKNGLFFDISHLIGTSIEDSFEADVSLKQMAKYVK